MTKLPTTQKGRKAYRFRGNECLNCGHPLELSDIYCSYCGQTNTTKSLSLKDFFYEFTGSVLSYDSRFWYTLKDLLFKPGVITKNYVNGQRLKYANPFRFFFSISIIFFLTQGAISSFTGENKFFKKTETPSQPEKDSIELGPLKINGLERDSITIADTTSIAMPFTSRK